MSETTTMAPRRVNQIHIRTSKERLWRAITEGEVTKQYFHATRVESDWRPGSPVTYRNADGEPLVDGVVEQVVPGERLVLTWRFLYDPELEAEGFTRVTWEIEQRGEICRLTVIHDGFDRENRTYRHVEGWSWVLSSLKTYLETGQQLPRWRA